MIFLPMPSRSAFLGIVAITSAALASVGLANQRLADHRSCDEILEAGNSTGDGVYVIDPDGTGGLDPFNVFCDMTTDGGGWTVVFHAGDPSIWGTTTGSPGTGEWSHDFSAIDFPMGEVILLRPSTGEFKKVTHVPHSRLYQCTLGDSGLYWNGTLTNAFAALHLGIHNAETKRPTGYVIVSHGCLDDKQGWGFGHLAFIDNQQGWGWDSNNLGPTVFAVGVRKAPKVVDVPGEDVPIQSVLLSPPNPNPSQEGTVLRLQLASSGPVHVRVVDVAGAIVRDITRESLPPGQHAIHWDGKDDHGRRVRPGMYFYRIKAGGVSAATRAVILR